jgi:hypothetical protein
VEGIRIPEYYDQVLRTLMEVITKLRPKCLRVLTHRNLNILTFDARGLKFKSTARKYRNFLKIYITPHVISSSRIRFVLFKTSKILGIFLLLPLITVIST